MRSGDIFCVVPSWNQGFRAVAWSVFDLRIRGGERNSADRQKLPSKEVVQKTALPGLKAPEHRHTENLFLRERPAALDEVVEGRNLVALANLADDAQRILYRLCGPHCNSVAHRTNTDKRSIQSGANLI